MLSLVQSWAETGHLENIFEVGGNAISLFFIFIF